MKRKIFGKEVKISFIYLDIKTSVSEKRTEEALKQQEISQKSTSTAFKCYLILK